MGIPKQVMDANTDAERELDALDRAGKAGVKLTLEANQSGKTPTNPSKAVPTEPTPAPEPPAEPQAEAPVAPQGVLAKADDKPVEDIAQLRADAEKWRKRMSSTDGRLNKLNEEWGARVNVLQKEIAGLKAQLEARAATPVRDAEGNLSDDARKSLRALLGEDYSDAELENFAKAARLVVGNPAQEVNDILAARDREAAAAQAKNGREAFLTKLKTAFPGFVEMDAANDPRLIGFYKTSLGGVMRGKTYGDIAEEALQALDYPTFELIVQEFCKSANVSFSSNGNTAKDVASQARPAARPSSRQESKPRRVPRSEIAQFRKKAFARRAEDYYGLTSQQVEEQLRFYEEAEENDRVDEEL